MKPSAICFDQHGFFSYHRKTIKGKRYLAIGLIALSQLAIGQQSFAATRVFFDDFEDGTTSKWVHPGTFPKCVVVSSTADGTPIYDGKYAMRCNWYGYGQDEVQLNSWSYTTEFFLRFWFKEDANVDHQVGAKMLRLGFGGPDNTYWSCQNEQGEQATMYMYWISGSTDWLYWPSTDTHYCGDHKWHKFEVYLKNDTNGNDGIFRFWLDGAKVMDRVGKTHTPGANWYPLNILSNWSNANQDDVNYTYWDNIEIYSDSTQGTPAVGSMADATISVSNTNTVAPPPSTLSPPSGLTIVPTSN